MNGFNYFKMKEHTLKYEMQMLSVHLWVE